ncbi:hypothetical protein L2E82_13049 [Cichorium intybus]|uniref:Uncharacterized protein n=1 Tax=Cichorium intybus TaxID=13427 RepID=A0ACB9GIV7_CICIN|nr:hypothetical protein L2E82_13049 [Cichorium intybus]
MQQFRVPNPPNLTKSNYKYDFKPHMNQLKKRKRENQVEEILLPAAQAVAAKSTTAQAATSRKQLTTTVEASRGRKQQLEVDTEETFGAAREKKEELFGGAD